MKKEVTLAIIVGFTIGLIITYGIYTAQQAIKNRNLPEPPPEQSQTSPTEDQTHSLHLVSPENETVSPQKTITITGTTTPGSHLVILTTTNQHITKTDDSGSFAYEITLEGGANYIDITAIDQNDNLAHQALAITYTTSKLDGKLENETPPTKEPSDE